MTLQQTWDLMLAGVPSLGIADITVRWERANSLQLFLALVQCISAFVVTVKKPFT